MPPLRAHRSMPGSPLTLERNWRGPQYNAASTYAPLPFMSTDNGAGGQVSSQFQAPMSPRGGTFAPHPMGVFVSNEGSIAAGVLQAENTGLAALRSISGRGGESKGERATSPSQLAPVMSGVSVHEAPAPTSHAFSPIPHTSLNRNQLKTFQVGRAGSICT